jgi:hypothetical protein
MSSTALRVRFRNLAENIVKLELRGGNWEFWCARDREILVEGPRGTGKTRTILEFIDALCRQYAGLAVLIVRKYQRTLSTTCLRTFNEQVLPSRGGGVSWFGGNANEPASYRYSNGARIVVGGMDDPEKVKSSEYDFIYENEGTELTEDNHESLLPLLRHQIDGQPVLEHQRIVADCNPTNMGNWLNQRCIRGQTRRIRTTLKDNPSYFDSAGNATPAGVAYLATLTSLTGSRRERWLEGLWTGTENAIYPTFDREMHVKPLPAGIVWRASSIGADQGRIHSAAAVAIKQDEYGRRWVVEVWGEPDPEEGEMTARNIGRLSIAHGISRVRTDPTGAKVALATSRILGKDGRVNAADGSPGARLARIRMAQRLLAMWPGGKVPTIWQEQQQQTPSGQWAAEESPGLLLVEGAPGIDALIDQIEGYHFVRVENETRDERVVARIDDDLVAAMEYGIEELETVRVPFSPTAVGVSYDAPVRNDLHPSTPRQQRLRQSRPPVLGGGV